MKWLWIGFAVVWALSVLLDGRRRTRASAAPQEDSEPERQADRAPLPALLTARGTH
jgi:hypothetical protein